MRTVTRITCRLVPLCCLRALAICLFLGGMSAPLFPQMASILVIDSIQVSGQKKTRVENILRELPFRRGDTVPQEGLTTLLADGERWLMQTGLFNSVQIAPQYPGDDGNRIQISIFVSEAWYIFPVPIFE
ncbi:MAG: POTRA domain-containing protein, partial [Haliscomenobacter sp.]